MIRLRFALMLCGFTLCIEASGAERGCLGASIVAESESEQSADPDQLSPMVVEVEAIVKRSLPVLGLESADVELRYIEGKASPHLQFSCGGDLKMALTVPLALVGKLIARNNRAGLQFVLGHELGHAAMLKQSPQARASLCDESESAPIKPVELLADFASGYLDRKLSDATVTMEEYVSKRTPVVPTIASLADYAFSNPAHHGRIAERTSAFGFGANSALFGHGLDLDYLARHLDHFQSLLFVSQLGRDPGLVDMRSSLEELYP